MEADAIIGNEPDTALVLVHDREHSIRAEVQGQSVEIPSTRWAQVVKFFDRVEETRDQRVSRLTYEIGELDLVSKEALLVRLKGI